MAGEAGSGVAINIDPYLSDSCSLKETAAAVDGCVRPCLWGRHNVQVDVELKPSYTFSFFSQELWN